MAKGGRRYARDNRGRFASVGATARGGRLRTAAGNKRATVTAKAKGGKPSNTIVKPKGLKPGASKVKPQTKAKPLPAARPVVRGNFRPVNTMAKPRKDENPFTNKKATKAQNLESAQAWLRSQGAQNVGTYAKGKKKNGGYQHARVTQSIPLRDKNGKVSFDEKPVTSIELNRSSPGWRDPAATSRERRASGWISTSSPVHTLRHEMGHVQDPFLNKRPGGLDPWGVHKNRDQARRRQSLAGRVSGYAKTQPDEFVAETYAGLRSGRKYDHQVMGLYREMTGKKPRNIRSQMRRRQPKPKP
jgi:hypothetical protein